MSQNNNRYKIQESFLIIGESKLFFEGKKIKDVLEIGGMLILLLLNLDGSFPNENVIGVSLTEKKINWQIAKLKSRSEDYCPFVGIKFYNNELYLNNWCDTYLIVEPLTGEILEEGGSQIII